MKTIILVYKTDDHHSYASRDLIAICTTTKNVLKVVKKYADKEGNEIDADQEFNLNNIKQTQGYPDGEFDTEIITLFNQLL